MLAAGDGYLASVDGNESKTSRSFIELQHNPPLSNALIHRTAPVHQDYKFSYIHIFISYLLNTHGHSETAPFHYLSYLKRDYNFLHTTNTTNFVIAPVLKLNGSIDPCTRVSAFIRDPSKYYSLSYGGMSDCSGRCCGSGYSKHCMPCLKLC